MWERRGWVNISPFWNAQDDVTLTEPIFKKKIFLGEIVEFNSMKRNISMNIFSWKWLIFVIDILLPYYYYSFIIFFQWVIHQYVFGYTLVFETSVFWSLKRFPTSPFYSKLTLVFYLVKSISIRESKRSFSAPQCVNIMFIYVKLADLVTKF